MYKTALYVTYTAEGKKISLNPPSSLTECEILLQLKPDSGKILKNSRTQEISRGLIIPIWKESLWEEVDIKD